MFLRCYQCITFASFIQVKLNESQIYAVWGEISIPNKHMKEIPSTIGNIITKGHLCEMSSWKQTG